MKGRREDPMAVLLFVVCCVLAGSTGVSGEPQRMTVGPTDTSVIQGQTAILKCVVEHIKGILQWAKDGVLLGSERDIPGFPRYKLIGSVELGEYNLMISRVSLADDAEYQCQVTPADGDDPLMGSAHLHVLIPPALPEIQNYPNGSVIKVPHEQETVNLTCVCSNGKPAATISWLRNNELIIEDIQYFSSVLDNKLEDARSILTVHPQHEDNGAIYTCRAINAAIRKPLDTVVVLSVMHPPSPPEITGYATGSVKTGETLKLVCTSKGGNPLAQVYWYKNDAEIDFSYTSGGDKSVNELVFTVQPNDNEAVYRCEASNLVTSTPLTAEVKLIVEFAPKKVTISGHQHAKAGEVIKLKCETAISNPPAVVTWFTRGRQLTGAKSVQNPSPKGGFVTTSEISVNLTNRENNVIYQCHATNDALGQTVVDTVTLEVMYPPEQPTISGYTEGREVAAGQIQSLTCTSVGGNPPAELTWWKGDRLLAGTPRITGNIVTRQVSFILKPDDNNAEYRCNATNQATEEPLITSVKLQVNFPPKILTITSKPLKPSAGQQLVITCMSSSSNPASVLSWWKDGSEIEGIDGGVIDAKNGGKSTISKLQLTPTAEDDGEIYACRATNPLLETAVSDAVTLDILYVPVFASDAPTIVNIVESHSETLNFTARGNPNTVSYTWYRDGLKLTSATAAKEGELSVPHFITDGPILNITSIKRTDTGTYVCEARNNQGKTDHSFHVNVQYSAGIIDHTKHVLMDPGTNATFECTVDANPMVDKMVTWSRVGYDMSRTVTSYVDGRYTLIVLGLVKDDSGVFTCNANNGIGKAVTADTSLVVKFAPEIDRSPAFSKAAAEKGSSAKLICKAEGAPEVTFKWFKNSQDLDTTGTKYSAEAKKVDLVHYESAMMVHNITEGDYTKYVCTAENELGTDTTVITLDGTSIPDPPYDMKFVNATHNSITLQWTAGFDGGSPQWFQVRYSETGEEGQKYEDVMPPNSAVYTIKELKLGTEYEMTVRAINKLGESAFQSGTVMAKTLAVAPTLDDSSGDDTPLIIILTVCIIGMILLALNILLILFFVRRRKKKLEKEASESCSRANTVEMFSAPTVTEDSKSFASYDRRSVGEYPDDYRTYDDEDEMKRFLPSMYTPDRYQRGPPPGMYPPPRGELRPPSPHVDHQRSFIVGKGSRDPIYLNEQMAAEQGWEPRGMAPGPYGPPVMMPRRPPSVELRDDTMDYADQLRKRQMYPGGPPMGDSPGSLPPDVRPKGGRLPPPPPQRSSSQKGDPPIPSRNYGPEDIPRYGPAPGSYTPSHNGSSLDHPLPPPPDMMGHLV